MTLSPMEENVAPIACNHQKYSPARADIVNKKVYTKLVAEMTRIQAGAPRRPSSGKPTGTGLPASIYRDLNKVVKTDSGGLGGTTGMHDRDEGKQVLCPPETSSSPPRASCPSRNPTNERQVSDTPRQGCASSKSMGSGYRRFPQGSHLSCQTRFCQFYIERGSVSKRLNDILLHNKTLEEQFAVIR